MRVRTAVMVLVASLMVTTAWAQARTEPAGEGPRPAMIVDGRALTPAAWVDALQGETVQINGVSMMWVGAAAKDAGGSATIESGPDGRMLRVRVGIRSMEFVVLPQGEFWRHPWVRHLIANASIYLLQPLPYWPYVEANIPASPPHHVDPRWPYLEWTPDEEWLLLHLTPPAPVEVEAPVVVDRPDPVVVEQPVARPAPAPAPPGPPAEMDPMMDPMMMDEPPPM